MAQSLFGSSYALTSDVLSQGTLFISTSSSASGQAASISQDVTGAGILSLNLQSRQDDATAGQEASVDYGMLSSSLSLYADEGQGAFAHQSTDMD
ncbi:MAG: hypothetical protein M0Q13_07655, partial [Methanothrix sp.]|nr:hypothetical protein [Methanothrix sp.]